MGEIIDKRDLEKIRNKHKNIIFCSGCYDILHSGHAFFFKQCKEFGDILVVSVGRDSTIKQLKGKNRPINQEDNRLYLLSAMKDVDYVVLGDKEIKPGKIDFYETLSKLKPNTFVLNNNDSAIKEKQELCNSLGIKLELVKRIVPNNLKAISSTEIIGKLS